MRILNKYFISFCTAIIAILLFEADLRANSIAFGYFINNSDNHSMDYLQQLLPNSFATSLKNKYDINTVKPGKLEFLNSEKSEFNGKNIEDKDLPVISSLFSEHYFVYGNYEPLSGKRIKLNVTVFKRHGNHVFSFTEEGKLETELFKFIDKVSYQIKHIASDSMLYKSEVIPKQSHLSIITNISGEDLNLLYFSFMKNGYKLTSVQGNDLNTYVDDQQILKLNTVSGANANYRIISNRSEVFLPHGTWSGKKYYSDILGQKEVFNKYAFNFEDTFVSLSKKILNIKDYPFDYFIVIGFEKNNQNAWVRCFSIKNNKLILTESEISGNGITEISEKIINSLVSELPKKF